LTLSVHPEFAAHGSFAHLKLGKKPRRIDERTLALREFLTPSAPPPAVTAPLLAYPMYDNNQLSDCTIAATGHKIQVWSDLAGALVTIPDSAVDLAYWETGDPPSTTGTVGGPTDDGRVELDVLNYWRQTGIGGHQIVVYGEGDPTSEDETKQIIYVCGGAYTGLALPLSAQGQQVWDVVGDPTDENGPSYPGSWGGHAVDFEGYDTDGVDLVTWGALQRATWAWVKTYCEELYGLVSQDFIGSTGKDPQGLDLQGLEAAAAAVTQPVS
jgi:hypothetical protein